MAIFITNYDNKAVLDFNPQVDGRLNQIVMKHAIKEVIYDDLVVNTIVYICFMDGSKVDLHYQVHYPEYMVDNSVEWGVYIDGVKATSNEDLFNKIDAIL